MHGVRVQTNKKIERTAVEVKSGPNPALKCSRDRALSLRSQSETTKDGFSNTALEVCATGTGLPVGAWGGPERGCGHDYGCMGPD